MSVRAYVDSSVWIARFKGHSRYKQIITHQLQEFNTNAWTLYLSEAVLLEVLSKPYRNNQTDIIEQYQRAFKSARLLPTYKEILNEGFTIAVTEGLRALDALHLAIATHYQCDRFITTDTHFKTVTTIPVHFIDLATAG